MATRKNTSRKARKEPRPIALKEEQSMEKSQKANWTVYQGLHKQALQAWEKLKHDVDSRAAPDILIRDRHNLLLLLGECNYIAGECMRIERIQEE